MQEWALPIFLTISSVLEFNSRFWGLGSFIHRKDLYNAFEETQNISNHLKKMTSLNWPYLKKIIYEATR